MGKNRKNKKNSKSNKSIEQPKQPEQSKQPKQSGQLEQPSTYQHFIPQFILRKFAHPYSNTENGTNAPKDLKKAKLQKGEPQPGGLMVHRVDLTSDPPHIIESSTKRILGLTDMYRDTSQHVSNQQHIEEMFSRLESRASAIFRGITKAFDADESGVWLPRDEVNILRKFLFLLKYRGSSFHRRFYHVDVADYSEPDSPLLQDYMKKKGIKRPVDVWLSNLKAIMELKMDPNGNWAFEIIDSMYHEDAALFVTHMQYMYMAICTPQAGSDQEFLLTDHCYNIFEGPATLIRDQESGKPQTASHASLHDLAPVTPKLMIVLRNYVFPLPEEDADPIVARQRAEFRKMAVEDVYGPDTITQSRLADLPITKARNSYSDVFNGQISLRPGWNGQFTSQDSFCFKFFPITDKHIDAMNAIILDNSWLSTTIIFTSRAGFARTLEAYLENTSHDGKCVTGPNGEARQVTLQKLAALSKELGSKKEPHWPEIKPEIIVDYSKLVEAQVEAHRWAHSWMQTPLEDKSTSMQCYTILGTPHNSQLRARLTIFTGGFPGAVLSDVEQARLMWQLRVRIDKWSKGLDEAIRERNRQLLTAAYMRCPPRRVWLYMKFFKAFLISESEGRTQEEVLLNMMSDEKLSSEDVIAKARRLVHGNENLNQLIYQTALNEGEMSALPNTGLWGETEPVEVDELSLAMFRKIVWFTPGIPEIERFAMHVQIDLVMGDTLSPMELERMETQTVAMIECLTRKSVQCSFAELLGDRMDSKALGDLEKVFFELTYPTPVMPAGWTE